jgi:hypothetical protein
MFSKRTGRIIKRVFKQECKEDEIMLTDEEYIEELEELIEDIREDGV